MGQTLHPPPKLILGLQVRNGSSYFIWNERKHQTPHTLTLVSTLDVLDGALTKQVVPSEIVLAIPLVAKKIDWRLPLWHPSDDVTHVAPVHPPWQPGGIPPAAFPLDLSPDTGTLRGGGHDSHSGSIFAVGDRAPDRHEHSAPAYHT